MLKLLKTLPAAALLVTTAGAWGGNLSDAQARYQQDRAACMNGQTNQDRATCLREAGAALQEARRGGLNTGSDSAVARNNFIRCDPLPQNDREDCVRRMRGEGTVTGSVEGGGIYRELVRPLPPGQVN